MTATEVTHCSMDPEAKYLWLEALRSGKWEQGWDELRSIARDSSTAFCCLGVLHDVMDGGWDNPNEFKYRGEGREHYESYLNEHHSHGLDIDTQMLLADMNDTGGRNFTEIADWIEENL